MFSVSLGRRVAWDGGAQTHVDIIGSLKHKAGSAAKGTTQESIGSVFVA